MDSITETIRRIVDDERRRAGVPGCAVVVVDNGRVVLNEGFGHRDLDAELPVTTQTLFPIGSATKTFTASVLASLADEGLIDLDAPLRSYLPTFAMNDPVATDLLSTRDCLSHRSGLPRHDIVWQAADHGYTRRDLVAALAHLPASAPFRSTYQYNNLLYIAAGEIAAALIGGEFEEAIAERLLRPLAMTRTNFSVATTQTDADHATPYLRPSPADDVKEIPFANLDLAAPAGGLNTCADELVSWLLTLTGRGVGERPPLLSGQVLADMRTPAIAMPLDGSGPVTPVGYGLGLMLADYRGQRVSHHGGNIDGFSCDVLTRSDGIGIAVLTNLHATWLRDSVPFLVLDALDGLPSPDHGTFFRKRLTAKLAEADAARALPKALPESAGRWRPVHEYTGRYHHPAYGDCVVTGADDETLIWLYRALPPGAFFHHDHERFEIRTRLNGSDTRLLAEFAGDRSGAVAALLVQLETGVPHIRFERVQ